MISICYLSTYLSSILFIQMNQSLYKIHLLFRYHRQITSIAILTHSLPSRFLLHWENRGHQKRNSILSHHHDSPLPWIGSLDLPFPSLQWSTTGELCVLLASPSSCALDFTCPLHKNTVPAILPSLPYHQSSPLSGMGCTVCKNTVQHPFPVLTSAALSEAFDMVAPLPTPVCPNLVSVALCYPSAI